MPTWEEFASAQPASQTKQSDWNKFTGASPAGGEAAASAAQNGKSGEAPSVGSQLLRGAYAMYKYSTSDQWPLKKDENGKMVPMTAAEHSKMIEDEIDAKFPKSKTTGQHVAEFAGGFAFGSPGIKSAAALRSAMGELLTSAAPDGLKGSIANLETKIGPAEEKLRKYVSWVTELVNPEGKGKEAQATAAVVAKTTAEKIHNEARWSLQSETRKSFWDRFNKEQSTKTAWERFATGEKPVEGKLQPSDEFMNRVLKGEKETHPDLMQLRRKYGAWAFQVARQNTKNGIKGEPTTLQEIFERAKKGDNPEDVLLSHQLKADAAESKVGMYRDLELAGLAKKVPSKEDKLFAELDEVDIPKQPPDWRAVTKRAPNGREYWVHEHAAGVLKNYFESKSLWDESGAAGDIFRGLMHMKNTIVPMRLSASLFHPLHVAHIDNAAYIAAATRDLVGGKMTRPDKWLMEVGKSLPLSWNFWRNPLVGGRMRRLFNGTADMSKVNANDKQALQDMLEGGFVPQMSERYRASAAGAFTQALREHSISALWKAPGALVSTIQRPIFEVWIPNLKAASYVNEANLWRRMNPKAAESAMDRQMAFRQISKSVDNRYGEMNYDTLFWKPWLKDLAVLNTLSLGWQLGFLREYGGGALDLAKFALRDGKMEGVRAGQLNRPLFVAAYTTTALAYGSLMTYMMTGTKPWEQADMMDYLYPQTGEKNPDGTPARVNTMFYTREIASIADHMHKQGAIDGLTSIAMSKSSGLFGLISDWWTGVDAFHREYRDPNGENIQKLQQTLAYTFEELEPIASKAVEQNARIPAITEDPLGSVTGHAKEMFGSKVGRLDVLGFTPAPKYATQTKLESDIITSYDKYVAPKQTAFEQAQYSDDFRQLRRMYQQQDPQSDQLLDQMVEKYELTQRDRHKIIKSLDSPQSMEQRLFQRLPWQEQRRLLGSMEPAEHDTYFKYANKEHIKRKRQ